jgi:hypothetical protein
MDAIGISLQEDPRGHGPLELNGRLRFDTRRDQTMGYFDHIAPKFEKYARRDSKIGIHSINVRICLHGSDLLDSLSLLDELETELAAFPDEWRPLLGTKLVSGRPPREIRPLLHKRELTRLINSLRTLCRQAIQMNASVVYGNGVLYRSLWRIPTPPGAEVYS